MDVTGRGVVESLRAAQRENLDQIRIRERLIRQGIAVFVPAFAVAGCLSMGSAAGASTPVRAAIVWTVLATTIPVGLLVSRMHLGSMWWSHRNRCGVGGTAFVAYADIGLATVLFSFVDHALALNGAALFAVVSAYAAHFVSPRVQVVHTVVASSVVLVLGLLATRADGDGFAVAAEVFTLLLVVVGPSAVVAVYTADVRREFARHVGAATRDPLTGVLNRRGFDVRVLRIACDAGRDVDIAVVDVDHFKSVNDAGGHPAGDRLLVAIAERLRRSVGGSAVVARIGGDEFAVADVTRGSGLADWAEALRSAVTEGSGVTVSLGAARLPAESGPEGLTSAVHRADAALYAAKRLGGNRAIVDDLTT